MPLKLRPTGLGSGIAKTVPSIRESGTSAALSEYARLSGRDRRYIKGQKYTLLSRRENLTLDGKRALRTLSAANKRLNTAYLLKESFGQLWSYEREGSYAGF